MMQFDEDTQVLTVTPSGELDHFLAESMRNAIDAMILKNNARLLVFDMEDVGFMDSSGIGLVMGRYKLMQELGGTVRLTQLSASIRRVMQVAGMDKLAKF